MVGGNITAFLQTKVVGAKNEIGESIEEWITIEMLTGWFDLSGGDSKYTVYNAKVQESTHIFVCDFKTLTANAENSRLIIDGKVYDIMLIDNPMELNQHLEIYLKFVGGQSG